MAAELTSLVLRARGGDELAFRRIVHECEPVIRAVCRLFYIPGATEEDVRQEALIALHEAVRQYQPGKSHFRRFASLVIRRKLGTRVRLSNGAKHASLNSALSLSAPAISESQGADDVTYGDLIPSGEPEPHEHHANRRRLVVLTEAIWNRLTEVERAAILGRAAGESYDVIAERQGITAKAVDNAIQRAEKKFAELLAARAA